jgi:hypothetical protein
VNTAAVPLSHARNRFQRPVLPEPARDAWLIQALCATVTLGLADQLGDRALSADEVADRVGSHPKATLRRMRAS